MRKTEKPIVRNNALRNERVLEDQRKLQGGSPYDPRSVKRQKALAWLEEHGEPQEHGDTVKPLRKGNDTD